MTSAKMGKVAGWLLVVGPLVDVLASTIRPGSFPAENPDGVQATMQAAILDTLPNSMLVNLLVIITFIASFGLLLGLWGVKEVVKDTDGKGYLRSVGFLFLMLGLAVRTASLAMTFLMTVTLSYSPPEAIESGASIETAIMFMVIGGSLGIFATILALVGVGFFGISLMNANLLGADKPLALILAVVPAVVGSLLLLLATFVESGIFTLYILGNVTVFVQVAWVVLLGVTLIRKSESLAAVSG